MGGFLTKSPNFIEELKKISKLDPEERSGKPLIDYLYASSPFPKIITSCLEENKVWNLDSGKTIEAVPVILLLYSDNTALLKNVMKPLANFLVKIKAKYYNRPEEKWLNLESGKFVQNIKNYVYKGNDIKVVGNSSPDIFRLCISFIKYGNNGEKLRVGIGVNLRDKILSNWGKSCFACLIDLEQWECGHILSVAHGGLTIPENLRPLCQKCNRSMGSMHMYEYIIRKSLPGIKNLTREQKKVWKAVVGLTGDDPTLQKMPINIRLTNIGKRIIEEY